MVKVAGDLHLPCALFTYNNETKPEVMELKEEVMELCRSAEFGRKRLCSAMGG
jgi:hypothetical protein